MTKEKSTNGWDELKRLIVFRLDQQDSLFREHIEKSERCDSEFRKEFGDFKTVVLTEIAVIQTKASLRGGIWGAITGLLGAIGIILIFIASQ